MPTETESEKMLTHKAAGFEVPKGPFGDCKGPPFNDRWEVCRGGGLTFLTKDFFLKSAIWHCRQLEEEVACKGAEIIRLHNREIARFRTLRRDVDQIKRALQRQGRE